MYPRRYTGDHLRLNMSDNEDEQPNPPPPLPPPAQGTIKLSPFWLQAPALWFAQAECTFAVKHVTGQFDRYCHVVAALPHESLGWWRTWWRRRPLPQPTTTLRTASSPLISRRTSRRPRNCSRCRPWAAGSRRISWRPCWRPARRGEE